MALYIVLFFVIMAFFCGSLWADVTVVAANVQYDASKPTNFYVAGATILAGQAVYVDTADSSKVKLADNDAAVELAVVAGIAVGGGSAGQAIPVQAGGDVNFGAAPFVEGTIYCLSANAGGICPFADVLASQPGNSVVFLGIARSANILAMPQGGPFVPVIRPA